MSVTGTINFTRLEVCVVEHAENRAVAMVCYDMAAARAWIESQGLILHWDDDGDPDVAATLAEATVYTEDMPEPYTKERSFNVHTWVVRRR